MQHLKLAIGMLQDIGYMTSTLRTKATVAQVQDFQRIQGRLQEPQSCKQPYHQIIPFSPYVHDICAEVHQSCRHIVITQHAVLYSLGEVEQTMHIVQERRAAQCTSRAVLACEEGTNLSMARRCFDKLNDQQNRCKVNLAPASMLLNMQCTQRQAVWP